MWWDDKGSLGKATDLNTWLQEASQWQMGRLSERIQEEIEWDLANEGL